MVDSEAILAATVPLPLVFRKDMQIVYIKDI